MTATSSGAQIVWPRSAASVALLAGSLAWRVRALTAPPQAVPGQADPA